MNLYITVSVFFICLCLFVCYILCLVGAEPCRHHVCQPGASTLLPACNRAVSAPEDLVEKTLIHFIIIRDGFVRISTPGYFLRNAGV